MPGNEHIDPSYVYRLKNLFCLHGLVSLPRLGQNIGYIQHFNSNEAQFIFVEGPNKKLIITGTACTPANSTAEYYEICDHEYILMGDINYDYETNDSAHKISAGIKDNITITIHYKYKIM